MNKTSMCVWKQRLSQADAFLRDWTNKIYDPSESFKDLDLMKLRIGVQAWVLPYEIIDIVPAPGTYRFQRTNQRPNLSYAQSTGTHKLEYTAALDGGGWLLLICGRGADKSPTSEELLDGAGEIILTMQYSGGRSEEGPEAGGPDGHLTLGAKGSARYPLYAAEVRFPLSSDVMDLLIEEECP